MTDKIVIYSTCGSAEEAERISSLLIERKLAACVTVITPVKSYYRWQGKVEKSDEWLLMIKTSQALFEAVSAAIQKAHSYEVPEVIAVPIAAGSAAYLSWLGSEVGE